LRSHQSIALCGLALIIDSAVLQIDHSAALLPVSAALSIVNHADLLDSVLSAAVPV